MSQSKTQCTVHRLDHLVLTVQDIPRTVDFYTTVLGMRAVVFEVADGTRRHSLSFGQSKINLHQAGQEFLPKAHVPTAGSADLCFLTKTSLQDWMAHLDTHRIDIAEGPVRRTGAQGPIQSLYIRDPDLNLIEISVPCD